MNKVTLIGRLTKDVEIKKFGKGEGAGKRAQVCLAIRGGLDKDGNELTDFIYCTLWNKTAEIAAKYAGKGSLIALHGRLADTSYTDDDGEYHYRMDVSVNEIELLSGGKNKDEDAGDEDEEEEQPKKKATRKGR